MAYSKSIALGSVGSLVASENAGVVTLAVSAGGQIGGGAAAGVLKAKAGVEVDVGAEHLIDLGFGLAEAQFPVVASLLKEAQSLIDAELAKA